MNGINTKETSRIEAFSDGVFAIAITLLVLELIQTLHFQSDEGLIKTCLEHWRSFLAFSIGFITILLFILFAAPKLFASRIYKSRMARK